MNQTLLTHVATASERKNAPEIKSGMTVRVTQRIREGDKERTQDFEGLVIATRGSGINKTFTVRKLSGGIGVEKTFPLHSKNISAIKIMKEAKIRRSKLYYMRALRGKAARLSEDHIQSVAFDDAAEAKAAAAEAKKAEEAAAVEEAKKKAEEEAKAAEEAKKAEAEKPEAPVEEAKKEEPAAEEVKTDEPAEEEKKAE